MYLASLGLGSVVASVQILGRRAILGGVSLGWGRFLPEASPFPPLRAKYHQLDAADTTVDYLAQKVPLHSFPTAMYDR